MCRLRNTLAVAAAVAGLTVSATAQRPADSLTKNPTTAVLLSLALPGAGQVYTEEYWKVPVFTGTAVVGMWLFWRNNADYIVTSERADQAMTDSTLMPLLPRLRRQRDAFRSNRDVAGAVVIATYLVAAIDAYVGAHLFDFSVDDDLSFHVGPTPSGSVALGLRLQF